MKNVILAGVASTVLIALGGAAGASEIFIPMKTGRVPYARAVKAAPSSIAPSPRSLNVSLPKTDLNNLMTPGLSSPAPGAPPVLDSPPTLGADAPK